MTPTRGRHQRRPGTGTAAGLAAVLAALVLTSCLGPESADRGDLDTARSLWAGNEPTAYRYTLSVGCYCPVEMIGPFEVTVRDGVTGEVTWNGGPVADLAPDELFTVDGLFDAVELASGDEVEVTYDARLGHPTLLSVDVDRDAVDDGGGWSVENFEVIEP